MSPHRLRRVALRMPLRRSKRDPLYFHHRLLVPAHASTVRCNTRTSAVSEEGRLQVSAGNYPRKAKVQEGPGLSIRQRRHWLFSRLRAVVAFGVIFFALIPVSYHKNNNHELWFPQALDQWNQNYTIPLKEALNALKSGVDHYLNGRYASALEVLPDEKLSKATMLGDYILFYKGMAYLKLEQNRDAVLSFRLLKKRYPDSSLIEDALIRECRAYLNLGNPLAVLDILRGSKVAENPEILYCRARALDKAGEKENAIEFYLRIYSEYPDSELSPVVERHLLSLSPRALTGDANYAGRLQRAENLIKANNITDAHALLLNIGQAPSPDSLSSEKLNLLMAEVEYARDRPSAALGYLHDIGPRHPDLHARALFLQGLCYRSLKRETEFLASRDRALKLYPHSSNAEELCYSAATYFDVNYRPQEAAEAYEILYQSFPEGRHAKRALWKRSLLAYLKEDYTQSAQGFWKYLIMDPSTLPASAAMFWLGRCYQKLGDFRHAKYLFGRAHALANNSFYGPLAREAEGSLKNSHDRQIDAIPEIDFSQVILACERIQFPPIFMTKPLGSILRIIERAQRLATAGLHDLAISELYWGIGRHPQHANILYSVMSRIHQNLGDYIKVISCLSMAFPDYAARPIESLPEEIWGLFFPVRHWEIISAEGIRRGIDPALILGLIRQESGFQENARSRSNARGLMQILPSTGRQLAARARLKDYGDQMLFEARTNIMLGTLHLNALLGKYEREELLLAAYNAGGTRANRWRNEFDTADMAEFVEQVPFAETRNYIKSVLSNRNQYSLRASAPAPASQ